jgi:hypothetical protein
MGMYRQMLKKNLDLFTSAEVPFILVQTFIPQAIISFFVWGWDGLGVGNGGGGGGDGIREG